MKKIIIIMVMVAVAPFAKAQLLHTLNINAIGGFDVILAVDPEILVTVTAGGSVEELTLGKNIFNAVELFEDEYYPENTGKLGRIAGIVFDYFSPSNTTDPELFGRVRRIGNVFFEYYGEQNCSLEEQYGKMKRAGYLNFDYFCPENTAAREKWGKIQKIDFLSFDYYDSASTDDESKYGLLESINELRYDYQMPRGGVGEEAETIRMRGRKNTTLHGVYIRVINRI